MFQAAITFLTWAKEAILSFMILNFTQRVHLQAFWIVLASDLRDLKDFSHLSVLLNSLKLPIFGLLAIAATPAPLLPLLDAGLAVDGCLAKVAEDGRFLLRHDYLLAYDAKGVGEEAEVVELLPVL